MRTRAVLLLLVVGLLLPATTTQAHHDLQFDVTQSTYSANAHPNFSEYVFFGSNEPTQTTFDLPVGYLLAHADSTTSPVTPVPSNGDDVGTGTLQAVWWPCGGSETNQQFDLTWDSTPTGGPSGTVAELTLTIPGLFTTSVYFVKQATNDYKIVVWSYPNTLWCSTTTAGAMSITIFGTVPGSSPARHLTQAPSTSGNYSWQATVTDVVAITP